MEIDADTLKPVYGKHDFPEDSEHENGDYQNRCCLCEALFWGHKRRVVCKVCQHQGEKDGVVYLTEEELNAIFAAVRRRQIIWAIVSLGMGAAAFFATYYIMT